MRSPAPPLAGGFRHQNGRSKGSYRHPIARFIRHVANLRWCNRSRFPDRGSGPAIELINFSYPLEDLDAEVDKLAAKLARIPLTQLAAMKLVVNQAYDNMGLQSTQTLGPILDGIMRNTPEGREFVRVAATHGVKDAVIERDGPFGDYSQAPRDEQPRKRSELD